MKKAEMGMGTLIIFIAMILVAAVAASVLISTTSTLQNKALTTGKETTNEVGTSLSAIEVYAEDGRGQNLSHFFTIIKLSSGSENIRFTDTLVSFNIDNESRDYEYNSSITCNETQFMDANADQFGISYQITGNNNKTGYLTKGDVAKICFRTPIVGESEDIKISIIPMVGSTLTIETTTPDLMINKRINIFP